MNAYSFVNHIKSSVFIFILFAFFGCSAVPVEDRYKRNIENKDTFDQTKEAKFKEFDISPYKTDLSGIIGDAPVKHHETESVDPHSELKEYPQSEDVWFDYDTSASGSSNAWMLRTSKSQGYRIQLLATDNLTEAEEVRTDLYFKTIARAIYIDFDPPFYKVKVGDFIHQDDAREYSFKLLQLGFNNTTIVKDSVIIYK